MPEKVDNVHNSSVCTIKEFVLPVESCMELEEQTALILGMC